MPRERLNYVASKINRFLSITFSDVNNKEERHYSLHVDGLSDWTNIAPGGSLQITWEINEVIGPGSADPSCIMKV